MAEIQLTELFSEFDKLQQSFGAKGLCSIYGAGQICEPWLMLVFMNPTAKNVSCYPGWVGIRAPWLGTKNVWRLLKHVDCLDENLFALTQNYALCDWTPEFAESLYTDIANRGVYITNFAKCTQLDARPLPNQVFKSYRDLLQKEISVIKPKNIVTFGNQVSENLLGKKISVSNYLQDEYESITLQNESYRVFPTYYPVGQGQRNLPLAKKRLELFSSI